MHYSIILLKIYDLDGLSTCRALFTEKVIFVSYKFFIFLLKIPHVR